MSLSPGESRCRTFKGYLLINSTYVDAADDGRTLKIRFRTDPDTPLWTGLGSITSKSQKLTGLNQSGREIARLLGALERTSSIELMSYENPGHFECFVVAKLKPKVSLRKLSVDIREKIAIYCGCDLGKISLSEAYDRYAERELKRPDLATASDVNFFDE